MTDYQYNHLLNSMVVSFLVTDALIVYAAVQILSRLDELLSKKNKKSS